jgi:lysophospholipase L1-like esterase
MKSLHPMVKKGAVLLITTVVLCVILELALRLIKPQPTYSRLLAMTGEQYAPGKCIPFTLRPGYTARQPSQEYPGKWVKVTINKRGFRGKEFSLEKKPGVARILVLGDSYTFGVYVADAETYPSVLESALNRRGIKTEVINAGYADGWSPDEHYAWLVNEGLRYKPDVIIYGFFIGNDITDLAPKHWASLNSQGLPERIENPDIYIDSLGRIRSKVPDAKTVGVNRVYRIPFLRESHLLVLFAQKFDDAKRWMSKQKVFWSADLFPFILKTKNDALADQQQELFLRLVKGMKNVAEREQAQFLMMEIPINFQLDPTLMRKLMGKQMPIARDYFAEIAPVLDGMGIRYLNLLEKMKANPGNYYPRNGEVHFNPSGNRFAGEQLAQYLSDSGVLKVLRDNGTEQGK